MRRTLGGAVFVLLLRLLPGDLRRQHGEQIVADLEAALAEARRSGRGKAGAVWLAAAADCVRRSGYEQWRREERSQRKERRMAALPGDIRYAVRGFIRQRGTTALLLGTLSLGMAAAIGVFGLINGVVLRPLPFPDSRRLVYLNETAPTWNLDYTGISFPDFNAWRSQVGGAFEAMGAYATGSVNLADNAGADRVRSAFATYDLVTTLGIQPIMGRSFSPEEDRPNGAKVALLVESLWRNRFGAAPNVVGQTLRIDGAAHTIIGVLPNAASFVGESDLWMPLQEDTATGSSQSYSYSGIGRLARGVTLAAARTALTVAHQPIWAATDTARVVSPVTLPLRDYLSADYRLLTVLLAVGAALVLLCACVNVASTMLARAIFRQREIGVRIALGADPARVTRQLLVESVVLATIAGGVGLLLGQLVLHQFALLTADWLPAWVRLETDGLTAIAAIALIGLAATIFGLAPALRARRADGKALLSGADRRTSLGRGERRLLHGFVIVEVVLATILLSAGGMLYRAYQRVHATDPGVRTDQVATFQLSLPRATYPDSAALWAFHRRLTDALATIPGLRDVGLASCVPLTHCHNGYFFEAVGALARPAGSANPVTLTLAMSPATMTALGVTLVQGRPFSADDGDAPSRRVLVSQDFADLHWPGVADPTGRQIRFSGDTTTARWATVVGVVGNVRHYGLAEATRPTVYLPVGPRTTDMMRGLSVVIRTTGPTSTAADPIRAALRGLDPELAIYRWQTMDQALGASLGPSRILGAVLAFFAAAALALAVGGLYGVLSYVVGRRRTELGLRLALGARPGQVVGLVVRQGLALVAIGWTIGAPLAWLAARAIRSDLAGLKPFEPLVVAGVALTLFAVGAAAATIPGRRAATLAPRVSLVAE